MKKLFAILALIVGLFSCTQEIEETTELQYEIKLVSYISPATRGTNMNEQSEFINGNQEVGVSIVGGSEMHNNVKWISDGYGNLENTGNPIYYMKNTPARIFAYQPYDATWSDVAGAEYDFTVQEDQTGVGYAKSDLLWATTESSFEGRKAAKLTFSHMLTKINVYIVSEDGTDFSHSKITLKNVEKSATFRLGEISSVTGHTGDVLAGTTTDCATAIIAPQTLLAGDTFIEVELEGKKYEYCSTSNRKLLPGRFYTYRLKVTSYGDVILEASDVDPWVDGEDEENAKQLNEYMHFTALEDGVTIGVKNYGNEPNLFYSRDKQVWSEWDYSNIVLQKGDVLYLKGYNPEGFSKVLVNNELTNQTEGFSKFLTTGKISSDGNILSLLYGDEFVAEQTIPDNCFYRLFEGSSIITPPVLSATILGENCYCDMFKNCTNLVQAPILPATTLASGCYVQMFDGCTSLSEAPSLPATTLAHSCYSYMFRGCTSLTGVPSLPATTLADFCYSGMFDYCSSLTDAPSLPVSTLAFSCYSYMFEGCTSLKVAPSLPATTLAENCYFSMFNDCTSLTVTPSLPATTLAENCYSRMFKGCTSLVSSSSLPATALAESCYYCMFYDCTSLRDAPSLPATMLAGWCYSGMFYNCASLVNAPYLPATTLCYDCYKFMFFGCIKLSEVKAAFESANSSWLEEWLSGTSESGTFYKNPNATWTNEEALIPSGWAMANY